MNKIDPVYSVPDGFDQPVQGRKYGKVETISYDSTTTEATRKASVLLPAEYDDKKIYPVLYLLHGIGGDHREWLEGTPQYVIGNLVAEGKARDMIVVMPNVRARKDDRVPEDVYCLANTTAFDNFIHDLRDDLMPYIEEEYPVAEGRENTSVAGLSMGGREALYIGITMADRFGSIGAFCPAFGIFAYEDILSEPGLFTRETLKLPDSYNGKTLLMICTGDRDEVVKENPQMYHEALEENGTEHLYYVTKGGHDFEVWKHGLYQFAKRIFQR